MTERDSIVEELRAFLLRAGEAPMTASILAEVFADGAEMLTRLDVANGGECRTARDRARAWMKTAGTDARGIGAGESRPGGQSNP